MQSEPEHSVSISVLMDDTKKWIEQFPELKEYSSKFEGSTGERMLQLKDDELLNEFGIDSKVDRQYVPHWTSVLVYKAFGRYLLLQLARVEEHERANSQNCNQTGATSTTNAGVLWDEEKEEKAEPQTRAPLLIEMSKIACLCVSVRVCYATMITPCNLV